MEYIFFSNWISRNFKIFPRTPGRFLPRINPFGMCCIFFCFFSPFFPFGCLWVSSYVVLCYVHSPIMFHPKNYNYLTNSTPNMSDQSSSGQLWSSGDTECNKTSLPSFQRRFPHMNRMHTYPLHRTYPSNPSGYLGKLLFFFLCVCVRLPRMFSKFAVLP